MRHYLIVSLLAGLCHASFSQEYIGARAAGLAYACGSLGDEWSLFGNPGGVAEIKTVKAAIAFDFVPAFSPFNRASVTAVLPTGKGSFSAGLVRSGDGIFNEQVATAGFASKLGIASLGVAAHYHQYSAEGLGSKGVPSFTLGGIAKLTPWMRVGAAAMNLTQGKISESERLAAHLMVSVALKVSDKVEVFTQVDKTVGQTERYAAAAEYKPTKKVIVRCGYQLYPSKATLGWGFNLRRYQIDYAFGYQPGFLQQHQVSLAYALSKSP